LLSVDDAEQLARFMQYVDGNIAREVGDLVKWKGPFWARRYKAIVVSNEEAAQVERLRYLLAHGVKENLVERCSTGRESTRRGHSWKTNHSRATGSTGRRSTPHVIAVRITTA
jgi:hypothetical protein